MQVREVLGFLTGFLVLAGFSLAVVNGGKTAQVFDSFARGFGDMIGAATLQERAR